MKKKLRMSVLFITMLSLILLTSYFGNERVAKATGPYLTVNVMDLYDSGYIVQLPNGKVMVVDGGTSDERQNFYDRLDGLGITHIDYLVGTHQHGDHIGNFTALINNSNYTIGEVDFPDNSPCNNADCTGMMSAASAHSVPVHRYNAGGRIFATTTVNGLDLSTFVFSPTINADYSNDYTGAALTNAYSMVFNVKYGGEAILFTGDAMPAPQIDMKNNYPNAVEQIITAPHHGYNGSIDDAFLDYVEGKGTDKIVIEDGKDCGTAVDFKYRLQTRGTDAYWSTGQKHDFSFQTDGTSWTSSTSAEWAPGNALVAPAYPGVCSDKLSGFWKFDETSGTTAADSSGNGHNGTLHAGASWTSSGYTDGALHVNGTSTGYVDLPFVVNPGSTPLTAAAMVKLDTATATNQYILRQNGTVNPAGI
jgi:beta-lactamase superfamily II metal-dependent hydrolase